MGLDHLEQLIDLSFADVVNHHLDLVVVMLDKQLFQLRQIALYYVSEDVQSFLLIMLHLLDLHSIILLLHFHVFEVTLLLIVLLPSNNLILEIIIVIVVISLWNGFLINKALHVSHSQLN